MYKKNILNNFQSISLLIARLLIAYGFYEPAINKWSNIDSIAIWFAKLDIPYPLINAYLATYAEILGVIFLVIGFFTRYISAILIVILIVAIKTVHLTHGFSVSNNGYEIPIYYIAFLLFFVTFGAGKISLDYFIRRKIDEDTTTRR